MALVEASLRNNVGVHVELDDPFIELFSESSARALVAIAADRHEAFVDMAERHGVEVSSIGMTGGDVIEVAEQFSLPISEVREAWAATLPAVLEG